MKDDVKVEVDYSVVEKALVDDMMDDLEVLKELPATARFPKEADHVELHRLAATYNVSDVPDKAAAVEFAAIAGRIAHQIHERLLTVVRERRA